MTRELTGTHHSVRMLKSRTIPQFVIERDMPGAGSLTEEQLGGWYPSNRLRP